MDLRGCRHHRVPAALRAMKKRARSSSTLLLSSSSKSSASSSRSHKRHVDGQLQDFEDRASDDDVAHVDVGADAEAEAEKSADAGDKFGSALVNLLSEDVQETEMPILAASKKVMKQEKELEQQKRLHKQRLEKKKLKKLMASKDHVQPQFDDLERKLLRLATRGVVTLFNAVATQKKKHEEEANLVQDNKKRKSSNVEHSSKDTFLEMLVPSKSQKQPAGKNLSSSLSSGTTQQSAQQSWSVLRDDFMMGAKLTDWDKEDESELSEPE